jgi:hypothetical protein
MNRTQLGIILALLVVVGLAGLLTYQKQNRDRASGNAAIGKKLVGDFPVNDVTQISLSQGTDHVTLAKKDDLWSVRERNDYPANYQEISDFLLKLRDMKVTQSEEVGASQLPRLGLTTGSDTNSALVVDFKDKEAKTIRSVMLGKKHMRKPTKPSPMDMGMGEEGWPDGRWIKVGDSKTVALVSDALSNIEPKPEHWLSKEFFKVEKPKAISVKYSAETNSWSLSRETETGEWKLADAHPGEQLDAGKTSSLNYALNSPSFVDVVAAKPEDLGMDKGAVVTIETFDGFTYVLKTGQKTNDNYPLAISVSAKIDTERTPGKDEKPEDKEKLDKEFKEKQKKLEERLAQEKPLEKWTYLVSSWTLDSVIKDRSHWMAEKKEEKKDDKAGTSATSGADILTNGLPAAEPDSTEK